MGPVVGCPLIETFHTLRIMRSMRRGKPCRGSSKEDPRSICVAHISHISANSIYPSVSPLRQRKPGPVGQSSRSFGASSLPRQHFRGLVYMSERMRRCEPGCNFATVWLGHWVSSLSFVLWLFYGGWTVAMTCRWYYHKGCRLQLWN